MGSSTITTNDASGRRPESILLSPIAVDHSNQRMEAELDLSGPVNIVRKQWVANLQKKRVAAAAGTGAPIGNGNPSFSALPRSRSSSHSRRTLLQKNSVAVQEAATNRSTTQCAFEKRILSNGLNQYALNPFTTMSSGLIVDSQIVTDIQEEDPSSMLFSGLDCFELESPSFSQLISSSLDSEHPLPSSAMMRENTSNQAIQATLKKRSPQCFTNEGNTPAPRTPRRKLNCGLASFDDFDLDCSTTSVFSSVEALSQLQVDTSTRHLWEGSDLDLTSQEVYADTFLNDLQVPCNPDLPLVPPPLQSSVSLNDNTTKALKTDSSVPFDQPRLIRSNSIEQDGLRQFFEQTNLDGHDEVDPVPLPSALKAPFSDDSFFPSHLSPRSAATTVDDWLTSKSFTSTSTGPVSSLLPQGQANVSTKWCRDVKSINEFERGTDEKIFSDDFDPELDSFYLDAIAAIGTDLDLLSN